MSLDIDAPQGTAIISEIVFHDYVLDILGE